MQTLSTCYTLAYQGLAGLDFDHEGLTWTPWGDRPVDIRCLKLHGVALDLSITGAGRHAASMKLNGKLLPRYWIKWFRKALAHSPHSRASLEWPNAPPRVTISGR